MEEGGEKRGENDTYTQNPLSLSKYPKHTINGKISIKGKSKSAQKMPSGGTWIDPSTPWIDPRSNFRPFFFIGSIHHHLGSIQGLLLGIFEAWIDPWKVMDRSISICSDRFLIQLRGHAPASSELGMRRFLNRWKAL